MKNPSFLYIISLFFVLTFCTSEKEQPQNLEGNWKSVGYGRVLKITNGNYNIFDVTSISCIPLIDGEIVDFGDALELKNDTLSLKDGINTYYFTRITNAPAVCNPDSNEGKEATVKANDPEYNFEVLWETFKDHYAYFELREVNPKAMYEKYRPMITQETSEVELFMILSQMLNDFNDGHIYLDATDEIEDAANILKQKQISEEKNVSEATKEVPKIERLRGYKVCKAVADKYIPNGTSIKGGNLRWGFLDGNVGYLQVNQMLALAETNLSDTLSYYDYMTRYFKLIEAEGLETPEEVVGVNTSLDIIMPQLVNTNAIIIDVRFNGGGKDEVGIDILKRFNDQERMVFKKKGKIKNSFTPTNKITQPASNSPYKKPVYLLIGPESASATEIMVLSALSQFNVITIGSNTEGVFSDVLDKTLPNGWEFGLSSEVYEDLKGNNYEGVGITPHIEIGYSRNTQEFLKKVMDDLENGGDASIDRALKLIKNN